MRYDKLLFDLKQLKPGMKVLVRADLNISTSTEDLALDPRIQGTAPLIKALLNKDIHVTLVTHLGRPKVGYDAIYSTRRLVNVLEKVYNSEVVFNNNWPFAKKLHVKKAVVLTENVRFLQGELNNDPEMAKQMVEGYDVFILEAFATSHRMHASNYGVMNYCPSYLGPLFIEELKNVNRIKEFPEPRVAVVGGGKSASKLKFLVKLQENFQAILLGGQMASLFMEANGFYAGDNNFTPDMLDVAREVYDIGQKGEKAKIILPKDLWLISRAGDLSLKTVPLSQATGNVVDIGPMTAAYYDEIIKDAGSVLQNGPMGVIENKRCFDGTRSVLKSIADSKADSLLGGGDTNSSIMRAGLERANFGFVSTGGGALLSAVTEGTCPALKKLEGVLCS